MKIDNTSMFFGASILNGTATAAWATAIGQSAQKAYRINSEILGLQDLLSGMIYKMAVDRENLDLSDMSRNRDLLIFSIFNKVFINNLLVSDAKFILLLVKEHSASHEGRLLISYPKYAKYSDGSVSNEDTILKMEKQLNCEGGCWFVYDISVRNQDELYFNAIVVNKNNPVEYTTSKERKKAWDKLVGYDLEQVKFDINEFKAAINSSGLKFSNSLLVRLISSLLTKPLVILTGLTGAGKTKLALAFVQWICESENQYKIVPVGADWTNREPLLGYPNGLNPDEYILPDSGALQILIESNKPENKQKPYFLILDEMNLSHVERYFADFLSVMESHKRIKLYDGNDRVANAVTIDKEIAWPMNLFIIGTVNVDETTYMFSPKVLDRANVIEFRVVEDEMKEFLENVPELDMKKLHAGENENNPGLGASMAADFLSLAENRAGSKRAVSSLNDFFSVLQKVGAEFGYRTATEINRLAGILETIAEGFSKSDGSDLTEKDFIDIAVMQKLLPKLHGSRNRLVPVLVALGRLCLDGIDEKYSEEKDKDGKQFISEFFEKEVSDDTILYKLSFDKIKRMYKNLIANGFTSYAEA